MDAQRVLITGVKGFLGQHVARTLTRCGYSVVGAGRRPLAIQMGVNNLDYHCIDLTDATRVAEWLSGIDVDAVIHLSGAGDPAWCANHPAEALQANAVATVNLLCGLLRSRRAHKVMRIVLAGTAHEYGPAPGGVADGLPETTPLCPRSPYGWTKAIQSAIGTRFAQQHGLPVVVARTFNLFGPGQQRGVATEFALRVVRAERGLGEPTIQIHNGLVTRDFLDVRDAARAYVTLATHSAVESASTYNVCSGRGLSLTQLAGLYQANTRVPISIIESTPMLQDGVDVLVGSHKKLTEQTGWVPAVAPVDTVSELIEAVRVMVGPTA